MKNRILTIVLFSLFLSGSGDPESGKDKSYTCSSCHGTDGNSIMGLWPSLAGQNAAYLEKQLALIKSGERVIPEMMGLLDSLNEQDLKDLAAYYASNKNSIGEVKKDLVDLGYKLYFSGNIEKGVPACTGCHSPNGLGNSQAAYPLLSGQKPEYIAKTLKEYRTGGRDYSEASKIMVSIAYKLDDKEIEALASFIHGLH